MLEQELKNLPQNSGIYQYFDAQGKLLYVGKAKNLKNRIRSYFVFSPNLAPNPRNSLRIQKMISQAVHLEFISTDSEADALILENSLIKQLHPKYNILLRDDKTYPYIYIDLSEEFPRFEITRKIIKKPKIKYFGPFFKGAKELLNALYLNFELKQKKTCKKACIFYQIKRCKGPCENKISKIEYQKIVSAATQALLNPNILIKNLEQKMLAYAQNENYEEAAQLRDQIQTIKDLDTKIHIDIARLENFDVFALAFENNTLSSLHFVIQEGKVIGTNHKTLALKNADSFDKNQIYKQLILEHFNVNSPLSSEQIYVYENFEDLELLQNLLSQRFQKKIKIKVPQIGEKRKICDLAYKNACVNIKLFHKNSNFALLQEIKDYFELENFPNSIEVFDNSHMQGKACVGAMIAYKFEKFDKNSYRHFHLHFNNDFEQMQEVLTRRAKDFEHFSPPDLWVIDGGKTLLNLAKEILASCGANVDVLAISKEKIDAKAHRAKGAAKDKIHSIKGKFKLSTQDKKLQFLQKLRDEAHRFAISFHQNTKKRQDLQSSKLKKIGISEANIQKLLNFFGNFDKIHHASFDELCQIIKPELAQKIKENL